MARREDGETGPNEARDAGRWHDDLNRICSMNACPQKLHCYIKRPIRAQKGGRRSGARNREPPSAPLCNKSGAACESHSRRTVHAPPDARPTAAKKGRIMSEHSEHARSADQKKPGPGGRTLPLFSCMVPAVTLFLCHDGARAAGTAPAVSLLLRHDGARV